MKKAQRLARLNMRMDFVRKEVFTVCFPSVSYSFRVGKEQITARRDGQRVQWKLNGIRLSRAAIVAALTT